jgi:hypothetical protein
MPNTPNQELGGGEPERIAAWSLGAIYGFEKVIIEGETKYRATHIKEDNVWKAIPDTGPRPIISLAGAKRVADWQAKGYC